MIKLRFPPQTRVAIKLFSFSRSVMADKYLPVDQVLPVELIKQHIRSDRQDEDDYLALLREAAVSHFDDYTGLALAEDVPVYPAIQQGLLLLIGHWYENREVTSERPLSEVPAATYKLWSPYVVFCLGDTP